MVLCWIYNIIWNITKGKKLGERGHSLIWRIKIGIEYATVQRLVWRGLILNRVYMQYFHLVP